MNLLALSDLHGVVDVRNIDLTGVDVCVLAGDIAPLTSLTWGGKHAQLEWLRKVFVPFMEKNNRTEFVFVAGNHDFWGEQARPENSFWPNNAHYLKNSSCKVHGKTFYGLPQVPEINGRWAFECDSDTMEIFCDEIPDGVDVLVTHTPPRIGGSDIDSSKGTFLINGEPPHFGSSELTDAIERVQPAYLFCGHIHTGDHSCVEIGKTKCFNVSLLDEGYEQSYTPFRDEIFF